MNGAAARFTRWSAARLDDLQPGERQAPIRQHFGITAFGINAWRGLEAGAEIIAGHDEIVTGERQEELYFVIAGRALFRVGEEEFEAPEGTLLFVPPEAWRSAVASEDNTVVLAVGASPGKPFTPAAWEQWGILGIQKLFEAGRYEEAAERYQAALDEYPDHPGVHFNLACLFSLAGQRDQAFEYLARSIELEPSNRHFAKEDPDLDPIKKDPRFAAITKTSDSAP